MDVQANAEPMAASHGDGRPAAGIVRHMSAGLDASLEQFEDPVLLSEGKISIIALDAIVDRLGKRWAMRQPQVYDHVDRTLERYLGLDGYFLRVSETDYIICQPHLSRFAGQAAAIRYLREILSHFLGESHLADHGVHEVSAISSNALEANRVDARRVEVAELHEEQARKAAEAVEAPRTVDRWTPFTAADGRTLRVSCALEPVFELKSFGRIGFRLSRRVLVVDTDEELPPGALANLSRSDILRIDLATIARGIDRLHAAGTEERQPSLIVPVSFTSLSSQAGRHKIVDMLKEANEFVSRGVICEVHDIEGVPQVALLSAVSLIRPFALFVVGYLNQTSQSLSQLKGAGLQAISLSCPTQKNEQEFLSWAKASIEAAKQIAKSVLIYRAASARDAGMLALLGATHASVRST